MNFEVDRIANVWAQSNECRIEPFGVANLKNCTALGGCRNHSIRFFKRARNWLLYQDVDAGFEQAAGDITMLLGGNRETDSVNFADQRLPIIGPFSLSFVCCSARSFFD